MKTPKIFFPIVIGLGLTACFISTFAQSLTVYNDLADYVEQVAPWAEGSYFLCTYYTAEPNQVCYSNEQFLGSNLPNPFYCQVTYSSATSYSRYLDCFISTSNPPQPLEVRDWNCTTDPDSNEVQCSDPNIMNLGVLKK